MMVLEVWILNRVRVANELGAGNGRGAKFATTVAVMTSIIIGIFFWILVLMFHDRLAFIFSTSQLVVGEVNKLSVLLAFSILLNSVQPVLSGNLSTLFIEFEWNSTFVFQLFWCNYLISNRIVSLQALFEPYL